MSEFPLLSDERILKIVRDAANGASMRRDGTTSTRIARAIESESRAPLLAEIERLSAEVERNVQSRKEAQIQNEALKGEVSKLQGLAAHSGSMKKMLDMKDRELVNVRSEGLMACNLAAAKADECIALREQVERLKADADRYKLIRAEHERIDPICHLVWKRNGDRNSSEWCKRDCFQAPRTTWAESLTRWSRNRAMTEPNQAAITMLRKAAKEAAHCIGLLTPSSICEAVHHAKHDRHGIGEVCPVAMRFVSAHQDLMLALKETSND